MVAASGMSGRVELRVRDLPGAIASPALALCLPPGSLSPCDWPAGPYVRHTSEWPRERRWGGGDTPEEHGAFEARIRYESAAVSRAMDEHGGLGRGGAS